MLLLWFCFITRFPPRILKKMVKMGGGEACGQYYLHYLGRQPHFCLRAKQILLMLNYLKVKDSWEQRSNDVSKDWKTYVTPSYLMWSFEQDSSLTCTATEDKSLCSLSTSVSESWVNVRERGTSRLQFIRLSSGVTQLFSKPFYLGLNACRE